MSKLEKIRNASNMGKVLCYIIGGTVLCAAVCVIIPRIAPYITGTINKKFNKISNSRRSDDDWGPIIEKKYSEEPEEE